MKKIEMRGMSTKAKNQADVLVDLLDEQVNKGELQLSDLTYVFKHMAMSLYVRDLLELPVVLDLTSQVCAVFSERDMKGKEETRRALVKLDAYLNSIRIAAQKNVFEHAESESQTVWTVPTVRRTTAHKSYNVDIGQDSVTSICGMTPRRERITLFASDTIWVSRDIHPCGKCLPRGLFGVDRT